MTGDDLGVSGRRERDWNEDPLRREHELDPPDFAGAHDELNPPPPRTVLVLAPPRHGWDATGTVRRSRDCGCIWRLYVERGTRAYHERWLRVETCDAHVDATDRA